MARARNIKPGFYKNEDLAECSIWARFIFPGLWMLADREGRLEDRPKRIKAELLAFDSHDVEPLLRELHARGFLVRYQNSDGSFIQISKFSTHQTPHYSEKQSAIKPPSLQEKPPDDGGNDPGSLQEGSGSYHPIKRGSQPPDSLNPDSLNPESLKKALSRPNGHDRMHEAREVLEYLNRSTGHAYRPVEANLKPIVARLKSGVSALQIKEVILHKCDQWRGNPDMEKYLRPETLFRAAKFEGYLGEIGGGTHG